MRKWVVAIAAAVVTGLLIGIIYPMVRPDQAHNPNDAFGNALGTYGIPAVFVLVLWAGFAAERRRK